MMVCIIQKVSVLPHCHTVYHRAGWHPRQAWIRQPHRLAEWFLEILQVHLRQSLHPCLFVPFLLPEKSDRFSAPGKAPGKAPVKVLRKVLRKVQEHALQQVPVRGPLLLLLLQKNHSSCTFHLHILSFQYS